MTKRILTTVTIFLAVIMLSNAQSSTSILLTDYTYTPEKNVIGVLRIHPAGGLPAKFSLKGKNARYFSIDEDHQLVMKDKYGNAGARWYDLDIEAKTSAGVIEESFRIVKDDFFSNKVIAHQGAWKSFGVPGNSIASLKNAILLGCEGTEFDVHMSADSVLFVHHDRHLQGIRIEEEVASKLRKLELSNGEYLPVLEAYLQEGTNQNTTRLILEIKPSAISKERSRTTAAKVVQLVKEHKAQGWVDYICFDYGALETVLAMDPYAKVAYLNGDKAPKALSEHQFYGIDYNYKVLQEKPEWIKEAHENGLTVNVWTIDQPEQWDFFLERKVDFITTDAPEKLLQKLKAH